MRLPRDLSGQQLAVLLRRFGYEVTRQSGSHMRLTTHAGGEHHITIPTADPLRVGTLAAVLGEVGDHFALKRNEVVARLLSK
jgi:predicted RNA binding protein YcfA (HicA-like mRNA interferase family)